MRTRSLTLGASLMLIASAAVACGGESADDADPADAVSALPTPDGAWGDTVRAAADEGELTMYSVMLPDINESLEKGFEKAYPDVDLEVVRVLGNEIDARLDAEQKTGADGADVVTNVNYGWMVDAATSGELIAPVGPNATASRWATAPASAEGGLLQTTSVTALGIAYNTDLITDAPAGYEDLLKPEFKGKIGLVNNADQAATDLYAWMTDTFGEDYWNGLAAQDPTFYDSAVPLQEALVSGEIAVAVWGANALVQPAMSEGAPVDFVLGDPGWSPQVVTYIPKWSAHPNAAQLLYDFLASDDGQAIVGNGNVSALPDVPGSLGDTTEVTIIDLDRVTNSDWVAEQQATWRETFGR